MAVSLDQKDRIRNLTGDLQAMTMMVNSPQFAIFKREVEDRMRSAERAVTRDALTNDEIRTHLGAIDAYRRVLNLGDRLTGSIGRSLELAKESVHE